MVGQREDLILCFFCLVSCFYVERIVCYSAARHSHSGNRGFRTPSAVELRNTLEDIFARDPKARACPAPRWPVPDRACRVSECRSSHDCGRRRLCCYNGCKFTCLRKMTPPAVIDWPKEPEPLLRPHTQEPKPALDPESKTDTFMENKGRETVFLPGGCLLTRQQYNEMKDFMTKKSVLGCSCINKTVQCKVGGRHNS